jgi:hypothetical protein
MPKAMLDSSQPMPLRLAANSKPKHPSKGKKASGISKLESIGLRLPNSIDAYLAIIFIANKTHIYWAAALTYS